LLRLDGKDLRDLPIEERKAKLEALLKKPPGVIRFSVSFKKNIEELLSRVRGLGLEGLIGKRTNSRYEAGKRTGAWVKIKLHKEQEFVIGGYTEPEGSRKHFGALLVGFYEPSPRGLVSILAHCSWVSMRVRSLSLMAESELALAKTFLAPFSPS
jgi:bifunctional non-homologous end joining protein LigD